MDYRTINMLPATLLPSAFVALYPACPDEYRGEQSEGHSGTFCSFFSNNMEVYASIGGLPTPDSPLPTPHSPLTMTSADIRQKFLDFFRAKGHGIVPSAPIVVRNDPTLMFTNAGMNQ